MKQFFSGLVVATVMFGTSLCAQEESDLLLQQRIQAHITFLADDLLRGRQPGTEGYDIAANYVASEFRQMGLAPGVIDGSYFQPVPIRRAWLVPGTASMSLERNDVTTSFTFVDEFFMRPSKSSPDSSVDAELVFAGYGIEAPELDYNDYEGLDVAGKIVVVIAGQPKSFPSEEGAHFSSSREVAGNAVAHGAPYALPELIARDEAGEAVDTFALDGTLHMRRASTFEDITSPNVVAYLEGSDPLLKNQYLVYTAHLDHIGELASERHGAHEDAINNGALDNASGIAVMLETARLFTEQEAPRRSVLFVAVTAEEKGLVGSEYFAHNPVVPTANMAAEINLDMPLLLYDFGDVIAFGAEHSTIQQAVQTAADEAGIALTPDPFPEQNIFVRSDHYRFVQQGVPAIFLVTGITSIDGKTDTRPLFEGFLKDHYHTPSDDLNLPIHYGAAARFTRINTRIGEIIANQLERPVWNEGDFFGETFSR